MRVLSLCDRTGIMVEPWSDAGHAVTCIDLQRDGTDVRTWVPEGRYDFGAGFPPCQSLSSSGARWWTAKGPKALQDALSVADACWRILSRFCDAWLVENPAGRLGTFWGHSDHAFHPYQYGGYLEDPAEDAYAKQTHLWTGGSFVMPAAKPVPCIDRDRIHRMAPSPDRGDQRSVTPRGFAQAVYLANSQPTLFERALP